MHKDPLEIFSFLKINVLSVPDLSYGMQDLRMGSLSCSMWDLVP